MTGNLPQVFGLVRCPECGRAKTPEPGAVSAGVCMAYDSHEGRQPVARERVTVADVTVR